MGSGAILNWDARCIVSHAIEILITSVKQTHSFQTSIQFDVYFLSLILGTGGTATPALQHGPVAVLSK